MHKIALYLSASFFSAILFVTYLFNTGHKSVIFTLIYSLPHGDKMAHIILYGLLTLGVNTGLKFKTFAIGRYNIYRGTCLVSSFVLIEEMTHYFIPRRTLDTLDLIADSVGIIIFTILSFQLNNYLTAQSNQKAFT